MTASSTVRAALALLVAVLVIVVTAACSGDGDDDDEENSDAATASAGAGARDGERPENPLHPRLAEVRRWFYMIDVNLGDEIVAQIAASEYELVVLDVNMPAPNGWQTLHAVLGDDPDQLVLMLSGFALDEEARERGARGLLHKPFDRNALLSAVDGLLSNGSS